MEKIGFIKEALPKFEDGSLVVWEDSDSINCKEASFESALPAGESFGMEQFVAVFVMNNFSPGYNASRCHSH